MAEPLVLINVFEVPADEAEQFIAAWEKTHDYLKSQPGYIDTALHQAVTPDADFQFVNVTTGEPPKNSWQRHRTRGSCNRSSASWATRFTPISTGSSAPKSMAAGSAQRDIPATGTSTPKRSLATISPWRSRMNRPTTGTVPSGSWEST